MTTNAEISAERRAQLAAYVEHWRRIGPELEQIRQEELLRWDPQRDWRIVDALLEIGCQDRVSEPTSGLVEFYRCLAALPR